MKKRRLPVLSARDPGEPEGDDEARPPWHWVFGGAVAIFVVWLPLAYATQAVHAWSLKRRYGISGSLEEVQAVLTTLEPEVRMRLSLEMLIPHALALSLASACGGYLVGRFGGTAGVREAALAGFSTAVVAAALSVSAGPAALAPFVLAVPFAALGGRLGRRARPAV